MDQRKNPSRVTALPQVVQDAGLEEDQAVQARQVGVEQHLAEARRLFDQADESPTNPEELQRLDQGFREVLQQWQDEQAASSSFSAEVPEALRPLFDDRAHQPPTNAEELLRLEQGFREVLQQRQDDQAASSSLSNPGMRAGPEDPNRSVSDSFATSGHAGVQAPAPPVLAASQQQIRPSPDALDQGNHLPPQGGIINNEHSTPLLRPAKRQRAVDRPQAVAIQQQPSEIGNSDGRMPMQPPMQQLGELPLQGVPVQGTGSEHIGRLHAGAAPSARSEAPPAAIEDSINVSFAVPQGFSHGTQRVPDAMLSSLDRPGPLPDAGQARQAGFEQHVAEPRRADPVASGARATRYPHLSDEHRDVIDKAIAHAAVQKKYSESTVRNYTSALRRLANDLGALGQGTDLKNHQSLVDHVDAFLPKDGDIKTALNVLRAYHEPPAPVPSKADAHIIEQVTSDSSLASSSRAEYVRTLRRFSEALESQSLTISGLDHDSRIDFAKRLFPDSRNLIFALQRVRDAESASPGARATAYPHLSDEHRDVIDKAIAHAAAQQKYSESTLRRYSHSLRQLANDLGARGQASDLKNHQSLVDHVDAFFPKYNHIKTALNVLRAFHEPGYSATGRRPDAHILEQVTSDSRLASSSRVVYARSLRRFSKALESRGQTISGLDHDSRIKFAETLFPGNRNLLSALQRVRDAEPVSDRSVADAFAATGSGHAGVEAAAPPVLAASQQQIRPSPDALDQGNHLPPERLIINNEHDTALLWPAERQRVLNTPQAAAIQQPLSEIGNSGGRVPMQPPTQQLGELPLEGVPVQGTGSEHIGRLHAEAAPSARSEKPPAAIEDSINVSFAVPKGFSHGSQRVPDAMLSSLDRHDPLPDAGQARQVGFEQHVAEPRRADPVASGARATRYPHLSDEHQDVIDKAIAHAKAQQHHSAATLRMYKYALRRLANDLGARGQATDIKNHQSLVDHVDAFFPKNDYLKKALNVLRAYHEPDYSATARPAVPSKADARILEKLSSDSGLALSTRVVYGRLLRRFSEELESRGQTISGLDHNSRTELAEVLFPGNKKLRLALQRVHNAEVPEALRPLFDNRAHKPPTNPEELLRLEQGFREVLEQRQDDQATSPSFSAEVPEALRPLFDDRAHQPPTNAEELLRLEQGFREVLQQRQDDQAASSSLSNPGMRAGPEDPNRSVSDAFATSGHAGVQAAAPPVLAASQQQIRPWPDALDQGNLLPPERFIINNEHSTAPLRPAERQGTNNPQSIAIQQPPSEGGRVPMQPPMQQLGGLPLAGVPVQGPGSEHIGSLHAEAAPFARSEAPPAAIENSINVSFAVPKGFSHGTQLVPEAMLSSLYHYGLLPDADKPEWNYEIKGHGYTARRPEEGNDVWLLHRGAIREAGAAAVPARAPGPALPATARLSDTHLGVPLVDLTTSSDAHIEALPSGSSNLPRGAVLGATELLGDEHIQRDYEFLEQLLQQADPALAARTRLVDPSVSHLLRHMEQQDARGTLQSIYNRNAGPSDFLFVPVNDGVGIDRGTHWSLLLVDRRDPERAVAYHYDSIQQNEQRYNDAPARKLATRLDATLVTPDMAQQKNAVDCGVFVVDGTRELVRRLANEERPDQQLPLHLNYLVADRQALQNRLREGRLPHELAASPAEALAAAGSQVQHAALQEQQARQVAPAPLERHLGQTREAEDKLTSTLHRSNRVNSEGVIINTERYTAPLRPAKRQRTDNSQSLAIGRQPSEANTTSIGQASDQARADLMASFRSRERSDAGR
ncbi:Ulp1 family isopeptidase [Mesorhizobium sp. 131-3-5]|nr:Ulp1 family isopeptidase [Mesorhizobium sp. 131-3-5]